MEETGSFVGSMCLCLCLSVWAVLTPPSAAFFKFKMENQSKREVRRTEREFEVSDGIMTFTYRQGRRRGPGWKEHFLELFQQQRFVLWMCTVFKRQRR